MGVFTQALGESFHSLADITRSRSPYGALILKLAGFPPAGNAVPVKVTVEETATAELWTRNFNGPLTLRMKLTAPPKACTTASSQPRFSASKPRVFSCPKATHGRPQAKRVTSISTSPPPPSWQGGSSTTKGR